MPNAQQEIQVDKKLKKVYKKTNESNTFILFTIPTYT